MKSTTTNLADELQELVPPRELIDGIGGGDFLAIGTEFFRHFTAIGGLQPGHRMLDVGCGCGRMAVPMIPFLAGTGEFWGFDIVPEAVEWAQKHITARYPAFHFALADICNKHYNPTGKYPADQYRFPYEDGFFDFTFLTSVFTHIRTPELKHYLSEVARTLKTGGKCMMTFFVLNDESRQRMNQPGSTFSFKYPLSGGCHTAYEDRPELAIAYDETFIRKCLAEMKLQIVEPIHYGTWDGRTKYLSFQDIILVVKQ